MALLSLICCFIEVAAILVLFAVMSNRNIR